ncbi:exodeoxyribonuclease V subunit beta [Aliikangiella sp. G2MR2-5]|uniref:UvrD-helicase domain-containing protein n=1 Tax=Aliikangiella sp. G2MR2-5 TaxID=2788943 RepID=UPI0018A8951C|nr:UvrD-helicase domain-containing protein [Aliikangiella sp. G2MR2-5]
MTRVVDQCVREELLNTERSFIVQAPAGSGKTELLTQRILALLTVVEKPENILAITFTKKAAAEMRERVVSALLLGQQGEPEAAHEKFRWRLAQKVLQRDLKMQWKLVGNPARLNITTIDSLSASLSSALPLLSQTGAMPSIAEDATSYYRLAVEELINSVSEEGETAENIQQLLKHKDNNLPLVMSLLSQMLAKRLQWLSPLQQHARTFNQSSLSDALENIISSTLMELYHSIPLNITCEIAKILNFASANLKRAEKVSAVRVQALDEVGTIDFPNIEALPVWKAIAELFLTAKGEMVKSLRADKGFPAKTSGKNKDEKQLFEQSKKEALDIAKELANMPQVVELLKQVSFFPDDVHRATQQPSLKAVVALLPVAAAHLKLVFSRYNVIDFSELALSALDALGHPDMPTDLALALDYRLEHILIDEFQDTSQPQIELIEMMVAGWEEGDGRSLFLVGDPMQSIYRFRDANVSLFMQIREQGIAHLPLDFRQLKVNFRSSEKIVNWVNQQFSSVMPKEDNIALSAVSYAPSVAFNHSRKDDEVACILFSGATDNLAQAEWVVAEVKTHLKRNKESGDNKTLAILARSRAHFREIVEKLNRESIIYEAIELDSLSDKVIVADLTNLAFALTDHFDELSWASIMRSPWFGLTLNDIKKVLTATDVNQSLLKRIVAASSQFPDDSRRRCERVLPILQCAIESKGTKPFRKWLAGCFISLGGMSQLDYQSEKDDFDACLDKLSEINDGGELNDRRLVKDSIAKLFAAPNPEADGQVQLMTIHKSKGLEFDTVILPCLDKSPPAEEQSLLKWTDIIDNEGNTNQLLAVSREAGKESDEVYQLISYLDKRKAEYEFQRVLYVAATRAKERLYLLGNVNAAENVQGEGLSKAAQVADTQFKIPNKRSYLGIIWKGIIEEAKVCQVAQSEYFSKTEESTQQAYINRYTKLINLNKIELLPESQTSSGSPKVASNKAGILNQTDSSKKIQLDFSENSIARSESTQVRNEQDVRSTQEYGEQFHESQEFNIAVGKVLHSYLEWIANHWTPGYILPSGWKENANVLLRAEGIYSDDDVERGIRRIESGLTKTLLSDFGRKILGASTSARSELTLHKKLENGYFLTRIIDRTFVDEGVRWIVDYKSAQPQNNESIEAFIKRESAAYMQQITDYFNMFIKLEELPVKAGLYFPMLDHFELLLESR